MDISTWLHQILTSGNPTSLGQAIYALMAPPKTTGRHCVFQIIGNEPLLTQDTEADEGTRIWKVQFRQFAPREQDAIADTASLRGFLVPYRDWPAAHGIMRVLPINEMDLPVTGTARLFCRLLELEITENLS